MQLILCFWCFIGLIFKKLSVYTCCSNELYCSRFPHPHPAACTQLNTIPNIPISWRVCHHDALSSSSQPLHAAVTLSGTLSPQRSLIHPAIPMITFQYIAGCLERLVIMAYWPFLYSLLPPSFHPVNCEAAVGPPLLAPSWLFFLTVFVFYWALPPIAANAILVGNSQSIIIASFLIIRYSLLCHATMWIAAQTITQRPPIPHTRTISNRVHQNHCGVWCHWSDILHPPPTNPKTTNMVPTSISRDNRSTG